VLVRTVHSPPWFCCACDCSCLCQVCAFCYRQFISSVRLCCFFVRISRAGSTVESVFMCSLRDRSIWIVNRAHVALRFELFSQSLRPILRVSIVSIECISDSSSVWIYIRFHVCSMHLWVTSSLLLLTPQSFHVIRQDSNPGPLIS